MTSSSFRPPRRAGRRRSALPLRLIPALALAAALLSACGSDPVESLDVNITGVWAGTWTSWTPGTSGTSGEIELTAVQTGTSVTGTVTMADYDCFTGADVVGTVVAVWVEIEAHGVEGLELELLGNIAADGTAMAGGYTVDGGDCEHVVGGWELTRR